MQTKRKIDWPAHIAAQRASGHSQQSYCKTKGLNFHSFSYHVQKGKGHRPGSKSQPKFLPVKLKANSPSVHSYELTLTTGIIIKLTKGFDSDELKSLIKLVSQS